MENKPLAKQIEPDVFEDILGQEHLLAAGKPLYQAVKNSNISNYIFFGPPGVGKTLTANLIAKQLNAQFIRLNAVNCGVKDIRDVQKLAAEKRVLLFLDEIHRFNKAQQEVLLPDLENGSYYFIGCTTQNPYFSLTPAINSRVIILNFKELTEKTMYTVLEKALSSKSLELDQQSSDLLVKKANGDARKLINMIEFIANSASKKAISFEDINEILDIHLKYARDDHYEVISAFIKSVRGSDPDAAVYWLARMLHSGEDPMFVARRLVILAAEDIGNAHPEALNNAVSCLTAVKEIGMPEARIILAQTTTLLASLPKSNKSYLAIDNALSDVENEETITVPVHLTKTGRKKYKYPHDFKHAYVKQNYLPGDKKYYQPTDRGFEKEIKKYLSFYQSL